MFGSPLASMQTDVCTHFKIKNEYNFSYKFRLTIHLTEEEKTRMKKISLL